MKLIGNNEMAILGYRNIETQSLRVNFACFTNKLEGYNRAMKQMVSLTISMFAPKIEKRMNGVLVAKVQTQKALKIVVLNIAIQVDFLLSDYYYKLVQRHFFEKSHPMLRNRMTRNRKVLQLYKKRKTLSLHKLKQTSGPRKYLHANRFSNDVDKQSTTEVRTFKAKKTIDIGLIRRKKELAKKI